jgi:hypothetical protein
MTHDDENHWVLTWEKGFAAWRSQLANLIDLEALRVRLKRRQRKQSLAGFHRKVQRAGIVAAAITEGRDGSFTAILAKQGAAVIDNDDTPDRSEWH